jgi:hypothetical protein
MSASRSLCVAPVVLPWPALDVVLAQRVADPLTLCLSRTTLTAGAGAWRGRMRMSEQQSHRTSTPEDEAREAGATSEGFGNLSVEDDAEGTVNPAELAGTGDLDDDAVDS